MKNAGELREWLARSLDDRRFSRGERQGLAEFADTEVDRQEIRRLAFEVARATCSSPGDQAVLDWLEAVVAATREPAEKERQATVRSEAFFSPHDDCPHAIARFIRNTRKSLEICVFTITDNRLAEAIVEAHQRQVAVRLITDNSKSEDLGSDIARLEQAGIPLRLDRSPFHMHHKFAVSDDECVLTGSYNWTLGAARDNQENLVISDDPRLVGPFTRTFDRLWRELA